MFSPASFFFLIVLNSSISMIPSYLASTLDIPVILEAVPPMWKVLKVNCVPGSPIDWAAITPTASPFWTILPVAKLRP